MPCHSTRRRGQGPADGPRRLALSERMDAGESKGQTPAPGTDPCFVYILECADGSYYVAWAADLEPHQAGTPTALKPIPLHPICPINRS
jgi:hypothetical protein